MTYTGSLIVLSCWCGIHLAAPQDLYRQAKLHGKSLYCPLGHSFSYSDTTEEENRRLRLQLDDERARVRHAREDADHQRRRVIAYKGVIGKTKKRIAHGVCPCCTRTFENLARHIATKHPDYLVPAEPLG
jgi:hypothetical protein